MYVWVIYIAIKFYHHFKVFMFQRKSKTVKGSSFPVALVIAAEFHWLISWCQWLSMIQSQTRPCADWLTLQNPGAGVLTIPHHEQFNVLTFFAVYPEKLSPMNFQNIENTQTWFTQQKKMCSHLVMQVSNLCGFVVSIKTIFFCVRESIKFLPLFILNLENIYIPDDLSEIARTAWLRRWIVQCWWVLLGWGGGFWWVQGRSKTSTEPRQHKRQDKVYFYRCPWVWMTSDLLPSPPW